MRIVLKIKKAFSLEMYVKHSAGLNNDCECLNISLQKTVQQSTKEQTININCKGLIHQIDTKNIKQNMDLRELSDTESQLRPVSVFSQTKV